MPLDPRLYTQEELRIIHQAFNTRGPDGKPDYEGAVELTKLANHQEPRMRAVAKAADAFIAQEFNNRLQTDPSFHTRAWMTYEQLAENGQMTQEDFAQRTKEDLQGRAPTNIERYRDSLPPNERMAGLQNIANFVAKEGIPPAEAIAIMNAPQEMQKVFPQTAAGEAHAAQLLAAHGLQRPQGATAVQTVRHLLKQQTGEDALGSRVLAEGVPLFQYRPSDEEKLNFFSNQVAKTQAGQNLRSKGIDIKEEYRPVIGAVKRAQLIDGTLQKLSRGDARKVPMPKEQWLDSTKNQKERRVQLEGAWGLAEMDGKVERPRKNIIGNDMRLAITSAISQHSGESDEQFHRENVIPDEVAESYSGLDTGERVDEEEYDDSLRGDLQRSYDNAQGE